MLLADISTKLLYFNSQPHKEADFRHIEYIESQNISTHSLTRRLTEPIVAVGMYDIFQLTASQGG